MGKNTHPIEQKLGSSLQRAKEMRDTFGKNLASDGSLAKSYGQLISRLREISRGEQNSKEITRLLSSAPSGTRRVLAYRGPSDGVARILLKHLPCMDFSKEDNLHAALLCMHEDMEQCYPNLGDARLPPEDNLLVILCALQSHPIMDFEEYKTLEMTYQNANPDDLNEVKETQRRFEQAQSRRNQHTKKHLLKQIPEEIRKKPELYKAVLRVSLKRDVFGSLDVIRQDESGDMISRFSTKEKLELLDIIASFSLGLASVNLDVFNITDMTDNGIRFYLQNLFKKDVGSNLMGVYAFEGVQNYPFGLIRIDPVLPRRVSNVAAIDYLRSVEIESSDLSGQEKKGRTYTNNEIAETVAQLQAWEVLKFLDFLKWEISRNWKARVGDRKRDILFADTGLKVRDILFLITHGVFDEEQIFENIFQFVKKCHPGANDDTQKMLLLANRYYFLDILGLNPGMLFNRIPRNRDVFGTLIQDVSDFQIRKLLHLGMSIFTRVDDAIFRNMSIAWNMLVGQCDGKIDQVFQEVGQLFDALDSLLIILEPVISDMVGWSGRLLDALRESDPALPEESIISPPSDHLRLATRASISNAIETVNSYCLNALQLRAKIEEVTPINIIQVLKINRVKSDKLRTLLHASSSKQKLRR
jgi:hypothetical protein